MFHKHLIKIQNQKKTTIILKIVSLLGIHLVVYADPSHLDHDLALEIGYLSHHLLGDPDEYLSSDVNHLRNRK
jgi:hypothetical protein